MYFENRPTRLSSHPEQIDFIRTNARSVAACAQEGYKKSGRGLVRVPCDQEGVPGSQTSYDFLPEIGASKLLQKWYGTKEARLVSGYDPQEEVIVIFVRKSESGEPLLDTHRVKI